MDNAHVTKYNDAEIKNIINKIIEDIIGRESYQQTEANKWTSYIVELIMESIQKLKKPFKYVVTCVIMEKNGAGLHISSACFWDSQQDDSSTVQYELKLF